ncbi:MAG TPA: 30S ribosomal protein S5 [Patescibacteria group bacterium]|nr:30S ribosomal protein S5 [Patescibacteria group bacterium]
MAMENKAQSTNSAARPQRGGARGPGRGGQNDQRRPGRGRGKREERAPREFEQKILDLARVTRVTAGGKRMSFRCALVIGDKKGRVGFGVAKGADVQIAIEKAYKQAKKHVLTVPLSHGTIPHLVWVKYGSALILLKPAPKGSGLKSGGAVRMILEFAGVPNAVSKIVNSSNKINIAKATLEALKQLRVMEPTEVPAGEKPLAKELHPVADNA